MAESRLQRDKCQPCRARGAVPKLNVGGSPTTIYMTISVYILHSVSLDQFYTGISKHVIKRGREHRKSGKKWTDRASDWREIFRQECATYAEARHLEKSIKARGAERFLADRNR